MLVDVQVGLNEIFESKFEIMKYTLSSVNSNLMHQEDVNQKMKVSRIDLVNLEIYVPQDQRKPLNKGQNEQAALDILRHIHACCCLS